MKIGFTGTQKGMTDEQLAVVKRLLCELEPAEVHHGDCIGADEQFHDIARLYTNAKIVSHPPIAAIKRAWTVADREMPAKGYLDRNCDVVAAADLLIATPAGPVEELRSGTWATVREARRTKVKAIIVFPTGRVQEETAG